VKIVLNELISFSIEVPRMYSGPKRAYVPPSTRLFGWIAAPSRKTVPQNNALGTDSSDSNSNDDDSEDEEEYKPDEFRKNIYKEATPLVNRYKSPDTEKRTVYMELNKTSSMGNARFGNLQSQCPVLKRCTGWTDACRRPTDKCTRTP
jgi:hypothetical protein